MNRKLVCMVVVVAVAFGVAAMVSSPIDARACKGDPNPDQGVDRDCFIDCPPCYESVCTHGGRCPWSCQPIPDCVPPQG